MLEEIVEFLLTVKMLSGVAYDSSHVAPLLSLLNLKILPLPLSVCSTRFSCRTLKTIWMGKASRRMPSRHKLRC